MSGAAYSKEDQGEIARLLDEVEQLRTALEASSDEVSRLAEDRDRLLRRLTSQARDLQTANAAYSSASSARERQAQVDALTQIESGQELEELRVAFEEMQVLTEELEVANNNLHETNRALDQRVEERTAELAAKNKALIGSELRFRTLIEGMLQLVWRAVDGGHWTWASPQWSDYTGQAERESHALGWLRPVHPDDRDRVMDAWSDAMERGGYSVEYRIYHVAENRYRWFQTRAAPVRDQDGNIIEWLGTSTDVDDLQLLKERQQLLLAELQHRVRNILTVIRSVFSRTVEAGGELDDIADHFMGRLDNLARTQVVVTQSAHGFVDLENLIRDELLSVGASDGPDVTIDGPDVALPPKAAESIGLAIHELTTNALKYGALKVPGAKLAIRWAANMDYGAERRLNLTWTEQGVPAVTVTPSRKGFGSELITEALPYRLRAETSLEFRGGGVRCTLSVPLPEEGGPATYTWKDP